MRRTRGMLLSIALGLGALVSGGLAFAADADSRRPSAPLVTSVAQDGPGQVRLAWDESWDDVGVTAYRVLANAVTIETVDATAEGFETVLVVDGLADGGWWFQVQAVDAAGNESVRSAPGYVRLGAERMRPPTDVSAAFDASTQCTTVSFDPSPDDRPVSRYVIRENLAVSGTVDVVDPGAGRRITAETCDIRGSGWTAYVQVEAESLAADRSVRTAPVAVYRSPYRAPTGFAAEVVADAAMLTWDEPRPEMRVSSFRVLDALQLIAEVPASADGTVVVLEPGRHWLQLVTVDESGAESRRTAPIEITVAADAVGSIGGWVFLDQNGDGLQSAGEPGVSDARVTLVRSSTGEELDLVTTGTDGLFAFDGWPTEWCYVVSVVARGAAPTMQAVGPDRSIDSDIDADGNTAELCFPDGATELDVDAGIVTPDQG